MDTTSTALGRYFGVIVRGQTYLNLVYLALAFPLGLFYFVFLVTGTLRDIHGALALQQALDQRRAEFGSNGVGALDAQQRRICLGCGKHRPGQGVTEKAENQQAAGRAPGIAFRRHDYRHLMHSGRVKVRAD